MADEKIITSSIFEQGVTEIMQDIANNLYEFEEYTEEEVANLIDLSEEEVVELTRVINDTTVALNKVYSNKKVEELLTELEVTCNKYADEKIGGLANIHLAYVDTLPSLGEDNTIYILKSTDGSNDTLNLYDGTGWISIGEFSISLDNYYDKTEIDDKLNDKANANEVLSQNDVVSDMSNVSSSTVLSTAGLEVELDKKIDKDSIATILDDTVTDEEVASAKAVYDKIKDVNIKTYTTLEQIGLNGGCDVAEIVNAMPEHSYAEIGCYNTTNSYGLEVITGLPNGETNFILTIRKYNFHRVDIQAKSSASGAVMNDLYIGGMVAGGTSISWKRVCTTTVADVSRKRMTFSNETYCKPLNNEEGVVYEVKNGICFVYVKITNTLTSTDSQYKTFCTGLPKPSMNIGFSATDRDFKGSGANFALTLNGELQIICTDTTNVGKYYTTFSYPVAE